MKSIAPTASRSTLSGCARTGFTTARTAARLAKFTRSRRVGAEVIRTELRASGDRRVRAGLRGAIEHLAGRHGMSAAEQREFADEVDRECGKAIDRGGPDALCDLIIVEQEGQIEVEVASGPKSPMAGRTNLRAGRHLSSRGNHEQSLSHPRTVCQASGRFVVTLARSFHKNTAHS